jgi:hypothetical protein
VEMGSRPLRSVVSNAMSFPLVYVWANNAKRVTLHMRRCRILVRGAKNSCLVEFDDGQREVVSRWAVRKLTATHPLTKKKGEEVRA